MLTEKAFSVPALYACQGFLLDVRALFDYKRGTGPSVRVVYAPKVIAPPMLRLI